MGKEKLAYQQGGTSIVANLLLFGLKLLAGLSSGSVALIADAWHTLSDSISSILVIIGVRLSSKTPDKKHPFGYGRWEQLAAIFIALLLVGTGFEIIRESLSKISDHDTTQYGNFALIVTLVSVAVKEFLAQYAFWCYRKTGYSTLRADGWHHRSDALSSVLVLGGILLRPHIWWIDNVLGMLISLFLLYAAYDIIRNSIVKLLGEEVPQEIIDQVLKLVQTMSGRQIYPHHFHLHDYGKHKELTFHIKLPESTAIGTGHELATDIEALILKEMHIDCTIHIEPENCKHREEGD